METITEREFLALEEMYSYSGSSTPTWSATGTPTHSATGTPTRSVCDAVTETLGGSCDSSPRRAAPEAPPRTSSASKSSKVSTGTGGGRILSTSGTAVEVVTNGTDPFLGKLKSNLSQHVIIDPLTILY